MLFQRATHITSLRKSGSAKAAMQPERSTGNAFIHRRQHLSLFYPFSLYDPVNCIGRGVLKCLGLSVRPSDFCRFHFGGRAKSEMLAKLVLRQIAAAGSNLAELTDAPVQERLRGHRLRRDGS